MARGEPKVIDPNETEEGKIQVIFWTIKHKLLYKLVHANFSLFRFAMDPDIFRAYGAHEEESQENDVQ